MECTNTNTKMERGYTVEDKGHWKQVVYSEESKDRIKKILEENPGIRSTAIRDQLFPDMDPALKDNAEYEIQVVLGRDYHGR